MEYSSAILARDISEKKELQLRLFQMDRVAAMGTLAAGVVHEIRNPLTYVISNIYLAKEANEELQQLADEIDDSSLRSQFVDIGDDLEICLQAAAQGTERVQRITDDMRIFSHHKSTKTKQVSVIRALNVAVRMTRGELHRHAKLETKFSPVPCVIADETRLSQVFVNLITNAIQAMEREPKPDHLLRIDAFRRGDSVVVRFRDSGPGMSQHIQDEIFRPFFTTKPAGRGTGLGLSLSKSIIEKLGGSISVDSTLGEGTTFEVKLPASEEDDDEFVPSTYGDL